jgi:hypothetical protein
MIFEGVEKALEPQTFTSPKVSQNPNNSESYIKGRKSVENKRPSFRDLSAA